MAGIRKLRRIPNEELVAEAVRKVRARGERVDLATVGPELESFRSVRKRGLGRVFDEQPHLRDAYNRARAATP